MKKREFVENTASRDADKKANCQHLTKEACIIVSHNNPEKQIGTGHICADCRIPLD